MNAKKMSQKCFGIKTVCVLKNGVKKAIFK
jgi:hypothetical protein